MPKERNQKSKRVPFLVPSLVFMTSAFIVLHLLHLNFGISPIRTMFSSLSASAGNTKTFFGENIDMSQILPDSQHYVVNSKGQDLIDIAANLGINLVRITNGNRSFDNNADSLYTRDQWNKVLNKMQSKGIKAIIQIEVTSTNGNYYDPQIQPIYLHLVQKYIASGVFSNPDVYAVDIKNEPLLTDANINMLQKAHTLIKAKYPNLKVTIGFWATPKSSSKDLYNRNNYDWLDFSTGQKIASIVDFYSVHMYGLATDHSGRDLNPDLGTKEFVSQVENGLQTSKPILIEEFGEANGDAVSDQDTIGNSQLQANVYQGVLQALKEMQSRQIIGAVAYDFYNRGSYDGGWAIVKNNGDYLFPAAYIIQEYATEKFNPVLQKATVVTSQSYLVTNVDNNSERKLSISDRIGLKLQLDDSNTYSLSLSTEDVLQVIQNFYYDPVLDSYYAVYQARSKGTVQLHIVPNTGITNYTTHTTPIYTLMITVQ